MPFPSPSHICFLLFEINMAAGRLSSWLCVCVVWQKKERQAREESWKKKSLSPLLGEGTRLLFACLPACPACSHATHLPIYLYIPACLQLPLPYHKEKEKHTSSPPCLHGMMVGRLHLGLGKKGGRWKRQNDFHWGWGMGWDRMAFLSLLPTSTCHHGWHLPFSPATPSLLTHLLPHTCLCLWQLYLVLPMQHATPTILWLREKEASCGPWHAGTCCFPCKEKTGRTRQNLVPPCLPLSHPMKMFLGKEEKEHYTGKISPCPLSPRL